MSSLRVRLSPVGEATEEGLFGSTTAVAMLDHFRIPYEVDVAAPIDGVEELRSVAGGTGSLLWMAAAEDAATAATAPAADRRTPMRLVASFQSDAVVEPLLARLGGRWTRARVVTGLDGTRLGSIWREDGGSVFLPFDPSEVVENFWSERYLRVAPGYGVRSLRRRLMLGYYRARPFLPRALQIWLRRRFATVQARSTFPRWPVETCLHDFFDLMFAILSELVDAPIPHIAAWPEGHDWALVLTHDVERAEGLASLEPVVELERSHGLRSAWNLVPRRYEIDLDRVVALTEAGFEVGVHGLYHDGRDLESLSTWRERLPEAHDAATLWGAVGFRSAALHRHWDWMRMLGLDYDASIPDTDPFEPQDGGCCTWLPFFNGEMVELPLTLPQDHTLFVILGHQDEQAWVRKAEFLRARGGLAMIDTHPDYLVDRRIFDAYARFLTRFAPDATAWHALPREVSAWWRRRAASSLSREGDTWRIVGPAAGEARIEFRRGTW